MAAVTDVVALFHHAGALHLDGGTRLVMASVDASFAHNSAGGDGGNMSEEGIVRE